MFIGRLGRDPELKHAPSGDAVVNISIAVGKQWKDKNTQEKQESTTWVPIVFWGKTAEIVGQYCKKGTLVQVSGEFTVRKYTDQSTGVEKYITEIKGDRIELLSSRDPADGGGQAPARAPAPAQRQAPPQRQAPAPRPATGFDDDSDIPF